MPSRRVLKAAEAIREVVSMSILADLKDPRIQNVTVTFVEVAGDMRQAKVHVSVMGSETEQQLTLRGLQNSAGFLQKKISNRIDTRYTPRLEFVIDEGVKKSIEIARILKEVLPADPAAKAAATGTGQSGTLAEAAAALEESDALVSDELESDAVEEDWSVEDEESDEAADDEEESDEEAIADEDQAEAEAWSEDEEHEHR